MKPLVPLNDPVLTAKTLPVESHEFTTPCFRADLDCVVDSFDFFFNGKTGIGLAATQIGIGKSICVIEDFGMTPNAPRWMSDLRRVPTERYVMVNPIVEVASEETVIAWETCLSESSIIGLVERPRSVDVSYQDETGTYHRLQLSDWAARIAAHEIDHLSGCLCSSKYLWKSRLQLEDYLTSWREKGLADALDHFSE